MTDHAPSTALTLFVPVPRQTNRADGWRAEVQRAFIEALADTGSVASACRMVGRSEGSAYKLKRHPRAAGFVAAWEAAQGHGVMRLRDAVIDRALNGVEAPVFYHGQFVGMQRHYDNRLAAFILRNHLPEQYGEDGHGRASHAIDKRKLERLKRQWREEWEEERLAAEAKQEVESVEALDTFFEGLRARRLANEAVIAESEEAERGPRERAAWAEYQRIRAEERGEPAAPHGDEDPAEGPLPLPPPAAEPSPAPSDPEPESPPMRFPVRYNPAHGPPPWGQRMW